jgi:glycosyltransferase involved in cell wall biosynthesis
MHISNGHTYMLSIIQFLNALSELITIDLLCLDNKESISHYLESNLGLKLNHNLNIVQIKNKKFAIKSNKFFFISNVIKHINKHNDEKIIIYTRDFKQMRLCIRKLKKSHKEIKFIFEVHQILSQNYLRKNNFSKSKKMKMIEQFVFENVDNLVCITSTLSNEIKRIFPKSVDNNLILPVGFNKEFLSLNKDMPEKFDLLYCGNFSKWKGLDTLLEAVSIINSKNSRNIKAILIGSNLSTKKQYEQKAFELNIQNDITIMERIEHKKIAQFILNSKVGIVPTSFEGDGAMYTSPLKLYEYLGLGMKVVVSRLPSIESNIDSSLVYYSFPDDPESLAESIMTAIDDDNFNPQKVKEFAKNYTWEVRAQKFLDFIA